MTDETDKKKIIIDEDWKSRVAAEREEAQQQPQRDTAAAGSQAMPPASFEMLLTTLATEAMISLGLVPHPVSGKQEAARDQARYFIDTLDMLQQKTAGNLTPDEDKALTGLLAQLRMAYVAGETSIDPSTGAPPQPPAG